MLWAGVGFSWYASSHPHYVRSGPFSSLHAWLRARAGAFATKNIGLLSHLNPAVSFQSSSHIIEIRRASKRTIKMSKRYLSRHFHPRRMGINALDPQDHGIKNGLRDTIQTD